MPDIPYKIPGTGETRYKHITSSQQRLMSKLSWEQTVRSQRAAKQRSSHQHDWADTANGWQCKLCGAMSHEADLTEEGGNA